MAAAASVALYAESDSCVELVAPELAAGLLSYVIDIALGDHRCWFLRQSGLASSRTTGAVSSR
jgi:hypothetical protein